MISSVQWLKYVIRGARFPPPSSIPSSVNWSVSVPVVSGAKLLSCEWVSEWVSQFIHSALKAKRVTNALQPRQTKMSLKDVWTVRVRRLVVAVWREDCSILSGPPPKSSCLQAECWFAEQWKHWRQPSEDSGLVDDVLLSLLNGALLWPMDQNHARRYVMSRRQMAAPGWKLLSTIAG